MSDHTTGDKPKLGRTFRDWLRGLFGKNDPAKLRENIEELLDPKAPEVRAGEGEDPRPELSAEERAMLANILNFGDLSVDDVKVPRADIVAIEATADFDDLMKAFIESGNSRIPVYRETLDDVIGMIYIKGIWRRFGRRQGIFS